MALFLDGIFEQDCTSPSALKITFPYTSTLAGSSESSITGLLTSEVSLSSQNRWGTIISDVSTLADFSSLMGSEKMFSWIGASVMCWKGTDPLKISAEFYLINYKRGLGLEGKLKQLNRLTSLGEVGAFQVTAHGGYEAEVTKSNTQIFANQKERTVLERFKESATAFGELYKNENLKNGTVTIKVGNKMTINNLLVSRLDVTPSIVEVPDGKPLYYRVAVSFTGYRPLITEDLNNIYG